jgi:FkbM family methyltransferase
MRDVPTATTVDVAAPWGATIRTFADDRSLEPEFFATGVYEATETAILQRLIRPGMTVLDVGAEFGYHAVLASRCVGVTGHVVTVEPEPANFALLEHNVRVNDCANVRCLPVAVSDRDARARLFRSATNLGRHSLYSANVLNPDDALDVRCTTLDALVDYLPGNRLNVLKIDAEGAEARILRSAQCTLDQPGLTIWVEIWPRGLRRWCRFAAARRLARMPWLHLPAIPVRRAVPAGRRVQGRGPRRADIQYGCFVRPT